MYSESLAGRVRRRLAGLEGVEEKRLFGGVGFLLNGNLLAGVWKDSLVLRLGPDQAEEPSGNRPCRSSPSPGGR